MNHTTDNLWSPEITSEVRSPLVILEQQAAALRDQCAGILTAEVRQAIDKSEGAAYLILDLIAPSLGAARHRILTARYFADRIYPCHVDAEGLRSAEVAHSTDEFRELVRQVLHSGEVKAIAQSLLVRARDERKALPSPGLTRHHNGHKRPFRPAWVGVEVDGDDHLQAELLYDERSVGD